MGCSSSRSQPGSEPEPEPAPRSLHHSTTTHAHVPVTTHDPALHSTQDHTHAHAHAHGHGQRLRQRERRRVVSYETPPHTCYPPVNTDIPNTIYIQQNDEEVITSREDDYCPIGAPGKLVIALKITATMMPFCSLSISGDVMGINSDFVNRNNYFYLIATNERHQLITVFEITYSDMISDSGSFYYELNSGHYLLEQIGVGDEVGLYVVKSPFWEPTDVACCRCSSACITIVTSESNLQNDAVENMMENPLANSDISDEQKWISFVQLTEDVIELLQATFRTSENRARFAVGSLFSDDSSEVSLQRLFAMEVDDIYDAAVDWLFTEGLEDDTNETHAPSREERVQSFISIRSSLSGDPEHVETPNTNSGQTQNLPQPVTKRVQSSFDKYCCICFVEYDDRVMTQCHHFFCRGCILDYIMATPDDTSCECPLCRRPVTATQLVSVPYGVAPSDALREASRRARTVDKAVEVFVSFRSNRLLPQLVGNDVGNLSLRWYNDLFVNRPSKSYVSLMVTQGALDGALGVRVNCVARNQGFDLVPGFRLVERQRCAVLLGRYNADVELCGVALIGFVSNDWDEISRDLPLVENSEVESSYRILQGMQEGHSLEVILVASSVMHSKCHCDRATISIY